MRVLILLALCLSGCAVTNISTKHEDGKQIECRAITYSMFLSMDAANLAACGGKRSESGGKVDAAVIGDLLKVLIAP